MRLWIVVAVAAGMPGCKAAGELFVDPSHAHLHYTGIWQHQDGTALANWQGSSVGLRFRGARVVAEIETAESGGQYRVILDGVPAAERLIMGSGLRMYELGSNLDTRAVHEVILFKETYSSSSIRFHGFGVTGTRPESWQTRTEPSLKVAFFGDSNMDGTSLYSEKDSGDSGTYFAFPASVSRMLNAEMQLQAKGGATLDGPGSNNIDYFVRSPDGVTYEPDFRTGFDPDVIVVNAGANDIFRVDSAGRDAHVKANVRRVVASLRDSYGDAPHIVLMNAYGWDVDEPANYTRQLADDIGGNISVLHFPWIWEQWHGSMWEHGGQAHLLARHIASLDERWSIRRPNEVVDAFAPDGNVTNGGFEAVTPFGGFGWRYKDDGVERIKSHVHAPEGNFYIRLEEGEQVHQGTDATGDLLPNATRGGETYRVSALMRSAGSNARARIMVRFRGQQFGTQDDGTFSPQSSIFELTPEWQRYTYTATAEPGVWTTFHCFVADQGVVEIDDVIVEYQPADTTE